MKRILVPAATALLIVVMLVTLNGWNRSGEPRLRITLTERELPLTWGELQNERGAKLRIDYEARYDPLDARNWLTEERLRALGFVFDVMPGAPEAGETYRRLLPKIAWVAFEYDGPAWREIAQRRALTARQEPFVETWSHLVPVDASLDRDALIARYPSGHFVLRASIQLHYRDAKEKGGPLVYAGIRRLIPVSISIPFALKDRLATLPARGEFSTPRYEVDIAHGQLGIPYVTDIRPVR